MFTKQAIEKKKRLKKKKRREIQLTMAAPFVLNSVTGEKELFVPLDSTGKRVSWYICGPTVWDKAHLGHARTYVTFDIIRRIMEKVCGYSIFYVMNITNVDDKIIRAVQGTDKSISAYAASFEQEFHEDMRSLGVRQPSALTRVSEFIPDIVAYVKQILDNGFAYAGKHTGSMYFDSHAFAASARGKGRKEEKKAKDEAKNEAKNEAKEETKEEAAKQEEPEEEEAEEEGLIRQEKKNTKDFALWKSAKEGEPSWDSVFGWGRPGWHVECSCMSTHLLGSRFDIHAGGQDLWHPHHTNEQLQAQAYSRQPTPTPWVNYFLHSGHLCIEGRKMSKSLKNFLSIREVLLNYTGRQVRLFFLLYPWHAPIHYSSATLDAAAAQDKYFKDFLLRISSLPFNATVPERWGEDDWRLHKQLDEVQSQVKNYLLDNFNYTAALTALGDLVSSTHKAVCTPSSLRSIGHYVSETLSIFGLDYAVEAETKKNGDEKVVAALAAFRQKIRELALVHPSLHRPFLQACNELRDDIMTRLGVRLLDGAMVSYLLEDPDVLLNEIKKRKTKKKKPTDVPK